MKSVLLAVACLGFGCVVPTEATAETDKFLWPDIHLELHATTESPQSWARRRGVALVEDLDDLYAEGAPTLVGDSCSDDVCGSRQALVPLVGMVVGVVVRTGVSFIVQRVTAPAAIRVASTGFWQTTYISAETEAIMATLAAAGILTIMASSGNIGEALLDIVESQSYANESDCSYRQFTPHRVHDVRLCTDSNGTTRCSTKYHFPCAGDHTHGRWEADLPHGKGCRRHTYNDAVQCRGDSPAPPVRGCDEPAFNGGVPCESSGQRSQGYFCGSDSPCRGSQSYGP